MKRHYYTLILIFVMTIVHAQTKRVTGTVYNSDGELLSGANILVKGTTTGTQANFDGLFTIETPPDAILVISFVGYIPQEIPVKGRSNITIHLEEDTASLEQIVLVGSRNPSRTAVETVVAIDVIDVSKLSNSSGQISVSEILNSSNGRGKRHTRRKERKEGKQRKQKEVEIHIENDTDAMYSTTEETGFQGVQHNPLSTFSIDVDKASYSDIRNRINSGYKIPTNMVKVEEMVNYFNYSYPQPTDEHPFAIHTELGKTPWNEHTQLVKIGLQGKKLPLDKIPASNLVFLLDVSGSMGQANKLPLLVKSFQLLVNQLREKDKVSIVVYAGAAGIVLPPTSGADKETIIAALENLSAGGSTAGGQGIELAYDLAQKQFVKNGNNRVILATDGDFNVGVSHDTDLKQLIKSKRESGIYLTCLGFGMGNYKDRTLEALATEGNGNHAYIDTMQEAQKVLGTEFGGTLYTIAKDVKIQVEFNPTKVQAYRLIGYENRRLNDEDFVDDTKDAGELGSGHTVTALYEVIPVGVKSKYLKKVPKLKYTKVKNNATYGEELLTVKFRYKKPQKKKSIEMVHIMNENMETEVSQDFNFAAAVAWFGMTLKDSAYLNNKKIEDIIPLATSGRGTDTDGYRAEFIRLLKSYKSL